MTPYVRTKFFIITIAIGWTMIGTSANAIELQIQCRPELVCECGKDEKGCCKLCLGGGGELVACTNCIGTAWADFGPGYQRQTDATCIESTCYRETKYQCAIGYYGTSSDGVSGCTQCPKLGDTYGTTTAAGKTKITDCIFPSDILVNDKSGTYQFTSNCAYTN